MERFEAFQEEPKDQPEQLKSVEQEKVSEREEVMTKRAEHVMADYFRRHKGTALYEDVMSGKTSMERAYRILKETGGQDPKTNLLRTELLNGSMDFEMWLSREEGKPAVVAMFDIDHFRQVNEELTHVGADNVLKQVADIIADSIRMSDDELRVSRHGGEEFVVLLSKTTINDARDLIEHIRQRIESELQGIRPDGQPITVSAGLAEYQPEQDLQKTKNPSTWLQQADQQLLDAKKAGRNRVFPETNTNAA